jgi:adenylate cyclase
VNVAARLQALAEPSGVLVSGEVHGQLAGRLALPFEDGGERELKNIPHAVRLFSLAPGAIAALPAPAEEPGGGPPRRRGWRYATLAGGVALAAVLAAGTGWWASVPPRPAPAVALGEPRLVGQAATPASAALLSIVVLPFANFSGDPGEDYVADGVTEDLTTALAQQTPSGFVVGGGAALARRGQAMDARQIGRDLGARHVVQGSARRVGPRLRVNAQVLDVATGAHRWAESYDESFAETPDLTRLLASRMAHAIIYTLLGIEGDRARTGDGGDPTALDFLRRGSALFSSVPTAENLLEARRLFERAVALDADSANSHSLLARVLMTLWVQNLDEDGEDLLRQAEEHATRALALDPRLARAHYALGQVHQGRRRFDQALAEFDIALAATPNQPSIHARRGWVMNLIGRPEEALAAFERAVWLSPRDPWIGTTHWGVAFAHLMLGRDEEAAAFSVRAAAGNPTLPDLHRQLASTLALVGRTEEARAALTEYRRMRPGMTVERFRRRAREFSDHPLFLATCDREAEALRAIGMPEE